MLKLKVLLGGLALFTSLSASAAAIPVDIDTMYVDNASAVLTIGTLPPVSASTPIALPAEITMGSYQASILNIISNDFTLNIYSTNLYGSPAPSGYVDDSTINVDFSSLRGFFSYGSTNYDFALWPFTTMLDSGTYNPGDSTFNIGWENTVVIDLGVIGSTNASLDVNLQGYLTTVVPLPAAVWLFGSGMLVLFGFTRSRSKKY